MDELDVGRVSFPFALFLVFVQSKKTVSLTASYHFSVLLITRKEHVPPPGGYLCIRGFSYGAVQNSLQFLFDIYYLAIYLLSRREFLLSVCREKLNGDSTS